MISFPSLSISSPRLRNQRNLRINEFTLNRLVDDNPLGSGHAGHGPLLSYNVKDAIGLHAGNLEGIVVVLGRVVGAGDDRALGIGGGAGICARLDAPGEPARGEHL